MHFETKVIKVNQNACLLECNCGRPYDHIILLPTKIGRAINYRLTNSFTTQ